MKRTDNRMKDYAPLVWTKDSQLSPVEQETVERNRRELWRNGVRTEPNLTRMAFEFGAVETMLRTANPKGERT